MFMLIGGNVGDIYYVEVDSQASEGTAFISKGYYRCIKDFSSYSNEAIDVFGNEKYIVSMGSSYVVPSVTVKGKTTDKEPTTEEERATNAVSGMNRYKFGISSDGGQTWTWETVKAVEGQEASYTFEDLSLSDGYKFKMEAVDNAGNTTDSNEEEIGIYRTITYDADGGTGGPTQQREIQSTRGSTSFTIDSSKPTKEGYIFLGWAMAKNSTSVSFKSGISYPYYYFGTSTSADTSAVTLYAVWQPETVSLLTNHNPDVSKWEIGNYSSISQGKWEGTRSRFACLIGTYHSARSWVNSNPAIDVSNFDTISVDYSLYSATGTNGLFRFYLLNELPTSSNITTVTAKQQVGDDSYTTATNSDRTSATKTLSMNTSQISGSYYITALIFQHDNSASAQFKANVYSINATVNPSYDGFTVIQDY